ncbi:unnamed protein product [Cylicocyclus nassatus]|uniref:7TM GPCR serpentine receptor class x (Srx) domain-containing protein n=1 Tax=Cylicocyclus nassatus TaxID=53992 RepID=A0AA36MBD0_CYLNA|nr:unnamed protein product [Cylicocyclus nassatus]
MHRFTAIFFPMFYQTSLCQFSATAIQLFLSWSWGIVGLAFWIIAPMCNGCVFAFDAEIASYGDDCPPEFALYSISVPIYFCSVSVFVVNILILWKLRSLNASCHLSKETDGIIQDSTFLLETLVFTFAPVMVESTMGIFICYSLIWELAHAVDGIIILLYNVKLPRFEITCYSAPTTSITNTNVAIF